MDTPSYVVEDDVFTYTSKAGHTIEIDLDIPAAVIDLALRKNTEDEVEQFSAVADWLSEDAQAAYREMGGLERIRFVRTFFDAFAKAAELPLGESASSSPS